MATRDCWNCEKDSHQTLMGDPFRQHGPSEGASLWFGLYRCDNCGYGSVGQISLDRDVVTQAAHAQVTDHSVNDYATAQVRRLLTMPEADVTWLPEHVLGRRFDDVPPWIADAASEAYACYSIRSYRAAILMARSVVEAVAKDKDITRGNLAEKIDALGEAQHIRPLIQNSAHEIRHLGNDMAHGDFVEPTNEDDAADVLEFMSVVLAEVYQLPAQVNARQATRAARKQAASELRAAAAQK